MFVVVQHDDQIAIEVAGGIQPFVSQARAQAAIADHRNHFALRALEIFRFHHAESGRYRGACMAGAKNVVFALFPAEESA